MSPDDHMLRAALKYGKESGSRVFHANLVGRPRLRSTAVKTQRATPFKLGDRGNVGPMRTWASQPAQSRESLCSMLIRGTAATIHSKRFRRNMANCLKLRPS